MKIILLAKRAGADFGLELEQDGGPTSLLRLLSDGGTAEILLDAAAQIPAELMAKEGADFRLLTLGEIRAKAAQEATQATQELEAKWQALVQAMSTASLHADMAVRFLGMKPFPDGATEFRGAVNLNLNACLVDSTARLRAAVEVSARCDITYGANQLKLRAGWRLSIGFITATPTLALVLPGSYLRFPEFEFPDFKLPDLRVPDKDYDVDLPTLPGLPLTVTHGGIIVHPVTYTAADGKLTFRIQVKGAVLHVFDDQCALGDPTLTFDNGAITVTGFAATLPPLSWNGRNAAPLPAPLNGVSLELGKGSLTAVVAVDHDPTLTGTLVQELTLRPTLQPNKALTLKVTLQFEDTAIVKSDVALKVDGVFQALGALVESLPSVGSVSVNLTWPVFEAPQLDALSETIAALLGAIAQGLAGLARIVEQGLRALLSQLRKAASTLDGMDLHLVLDARNGQLQQLVLGLHRAAGGGREIVSEPALALTAPTEVELALLIDLRDGERDAYLVATTGTLDDELLSLGSDLWFGAPEFESQASGVAEASQEGGGTARQKMINVAVTSKQHGQRFSFVPFGLRHGDAVFFYALDTALPAFAATPTVAFSGYRLKDPLGDAISAQVTYDVEAAKRFLPFLAAPREDKSDEHGGLASMLKQYIEIKSVGDARLEDGKFASDAQIDLKTMGSTIGSTLKIELDARRMTAAVRGSAIHLSLPNDKPLELLGMRASFTNRAEPDKPVVGDQFVLDMGGPDTRLYLNDAYDMVLDFDRLGKDATGKTLRFQVSHLVVHGGGMDLVASLAAPFTLRLNGLETDFTFEKADIQVRSGRIESFTLAALGKLPPKLLGDVDVRMQLDFGVRADGSIGLLKGTIGLKSKGKPIRSEQTHFVLTLDGLSMMVFEDGGALHFCAFVSGSAVFKPEAPALAEGMLKKLAGVELKFRDCPVCGPSDVIARELEKLNLSFVVALDEPVKATLFNLFTFEVRSFGFEPKCRAFDDDPPAIVIGGQVRFAATGDVIRAECDFHKLYLAPPKPGEFLPRLKCEGLGLALRLGGALEIEGKVVAVDGSMPGVLVSEPPTERIKGKGFMGQGRVAIPGLPPFAASFGFVELVLPNTGERVLAWFVYLEAQHLSYHFQLGPVPIFLRDAGIGLGFHFTYVGIEAVDQATNLIDMIKAMDKLAATAVDPANVDTWSASAQPDLTLVGRMFISMSSASAPSEPLKWKPDEEKDLPNVMLLNVIAAMRKSTFLMTANVWLGYNYHDWDQGRHLGDNDLVGKQAMTGYVILAGARSEFLARVKSNRGAEVGPRLAMPQQFKDALKEVDYEATLYIRPGLLHFELGWPNRIRWSKNFAGVNVSVAGGAIFRVHEGAILAGLNLEGNLDFSMSARLDAGVVGVAVSASVYAALAARIIGYLDSQKAGNSMYYALFSLQVQVQFAVSAWLEIDAWLCKITINISFALSLQIDVVAELALQGDAQTGTRVRAAIGISIFGRSLGLSVGLSINPGLVDSSAARVCRFMNMGLMQEVPSVTPEIGQQDAANDTASRLGDERREARAVAARANVGGKLAPVPHEDPLPVELAETEPAEALEIGATDFQIVLTYPKVLPVIATGEVAPGHLEDWVYLTFLPKDAALGVKDVAKQEKSSFYAAPPSHPTLNSEAEHIVLFPKAAAKEEMFVYDATRPGWKRVSLDADDPRLVTKVDWERKLDYTQKTAEDNPTPSEAAGAATLEQLFFAAFRTDAKKVDEVAGDKRYREPNARPPIDERARIERTANKTQQQHDRQEYGYNRNLIQDPADRRCHEARDFLMHSFASDLFQLAADGIVPDKVHVVHLGLTLLVRRSLAETLCAKESPARVQKRVEVIPGGAVSADCAVFNPPALMFSRKPPRFDRANCQFDGRKARLDWDLTWDHDIDPEYFVQRYEVLRWIEVNGRPVGERSKISFKRADNVAENIDGSSRTVERSHWQLTDEFEDMSAANKESLFDPVSSAVLRYTVVPLCVSGTLGRPCSDFMAVRTGMPQLTPIRKASAILEIDPRPVGPKRDQLAPPELLLRLESGTDRLEGSDQRYWRLILRSEAIIPAGEYGGDGQTDRALGATIGAALTRRRTDVTFFLPAGLDNTFPPAAADDEHAPLGVRLPELIARLQDVVDPRAYTLLAQTYVIRDRVEISSSPLIPVELGIVVIANQQNPNQLQSLMTRVDALEMVRLPLAAEETVLDPVAHVDLRAIPGRAVMREPVAGATVVDSRYHDTLHPDYGGVIALSWDVRPSGLAANALAPYRLLAGFDVYSLDLDVGDVAEDKHAWQSKRVRRQTSAQLLSPEAVRLTPPEIGEPSNWKVRYPSQAARRQAGGAWYSPAESRIAWPMSEIRRELLPEPPSELIKSVLRDGVPKYIELALTGGAAEIEWRFALSTAPGAVDSWRLEGTDRLTYIGDKGVAAAALRRQLRSLQAMPKETPPGGFATADKRGWTLSLTAIWEPTGFTSHALASETVPMLFDRDLHPLLEAVMARMRRLRSSATRGERLLDLDRRPAPAVQAMNVDEFLAATSDTLDPYGWAMLDRLGLGVTLRLFDPVDDGFLGPHELYAQLNEALEDPTLAEMYPEAMGQLFVEVLLQPGAMMDRVEFASMPDGQGVIGEEYRGDMLRDTQGLAMLRLSVRPSIQKELQYKVWSELSDKASDATLAGVDAYVPLRAAYRRLDGLSLKKFLSELEAGDIADEKDRQRHAQTVFLRGKNLVLESATSDKEPGGTVDAFGRFPDWEGWNEDTDDSRQRFRLLLRNALAVPRSDKQGDDQVIKDTVNTQWKTLNARFFEFAADPGSAAGLQFALAAVEPVEPRRVAANGAGQLTVLLPETDGYAHMRALAVLPQWRYGRLLRDAGYGNELEQVLRQKRQDAIVDASGAAQHRYAIASVLRTAPIQPPDVLAVARLGDAVWWRAEDGVWEQEGLRRNAAELREAAFSRIGTDPGEALPIIVRHHTELRLSKSNVMPARSLSMAGTLTSFVLRPADQAWCAHFLPLDELEPVQRKSTDWPAGVDVELVAQVAQRVGQLPVDSKLRVLRHLPHWYRHGISLSAGAGSAVAQTVSAYLAEAPSRLVEMQGGIPMVKSEHPWKNLLAPGQIAPIAVIPSGHGPYPQFGLVLPALCYRDTTSSATADLWAGKIADLPDPGVIYDVLFEAEKQPLRPRASVTPVARITRAPDLQGGALLSTFLLSREWQVDAALESASVSAGPHQLRISITPMSLDLPIRDDQLKQMLQNEPYLHGDSLRVPGGWSEEWLDHFVGALAGQGVDAGIKGAALLWTALAEREVGMPVRDAEGVTLFPSYGLATFELVRPTDDAGWQTLADVLNDWLAQLAAAPGALAALLSDFFAPVAKSITAKEWPADDPSGKPIPWLSSLPVPTAGIGQALQLPRMLIPELMTDNQYDTALAEATNAGKTVLTTRLEQMRADQRERASAGGKLRIRATRGDAIPLQLPLVALS